ncbi:MAG TPA: GtrA family protein [Gammaproteobacteria bacterium]|nr:GtrA family protein [Gammaproteobacteria bacterium]
MLQHIKQSEFTRFLFAGGLAALVNFLSRFAYNEVMSFRLAVIAAYITGMVTAYVLSRLFVFAKSRHHPAKEFTYFTLVNLLAVLQVWLISVGLAEYLFPATGFTFYPYAVAHAVGVAVPAVTSYFGHKYLSFARDED